MERRGSRREGGRKGGMERGGVRVISLVYVLWVRRLQPQGRCDKCKRKLVSASNKWQFWSSNPALKSGFFNKEGCYLTSLETLPSHFPLNIPQWIFRCQCREINLKAMLSSWDSEDLETQISGDTETCQKIRKCPQYSVLQVGSLWASCMKCKGLILKSAHCSFFTQHSPCSPFINCT